MPDAGRASRSIRPPAPSSSGSRAAAPRPCGRSMRTVHRSTRTMHKGGRCPLMQSDDFRGTLRSYPARPDLGGHVRFHATIKLAGKTATGIEIPDEVVAALGAGRKPPVRGTGAGPTYPSTVAVRGDRYLVGVSAENREAAGVAAGDEVDVDIELDTAPRE